MASNSQGEAEEMDGCILIVIICKGFFSGIGLQGSGMGSHMVHIIFLKFFCPCS